MQGWALFEEAVEAAGVGDLPQLLCNIRGMMTPTPPNTSTSSNERSGSPSNKQTCTVTGEAGGNKQTSDCSHRGKKMGLPSVQHG